MGQCDQSTEIIANVNDFMWKKKKRQLLSKLQSARSSQYSPLETLNYSSLQNGK